MQQFHRTRLTLADIGEVAFLKKISQSLAQRFAHVLIGPGDDAAVLRTGFKNVHACHVLSTDMLIEHVDFKMQWATYADIGHKAAAVNLSDLAAMGAYPRALVAAVAFSPDTQVKQALDLLKSLHKLGEQFGAPLVGGDISSTKGPLVVSVTALGEILKNKMLRRYTAHLHDVVLVTGALGGAAAGLQLLEANRRLPRVLVRRQLRPQPQLLVAQHLAKSGHVTACADISDGLVKDILYLPRPHLGIELDIRQVPMARELLAYVNHNHAQALSLALAGGEDYELIYTVPAQHVGSIMSLTQALGVVSTPIGRVIKKPGLHTQDYLLPQTITAYDHFA